MGKWGRMIKAGRYFFNPCEINSIRVDNYSNTRLVLNALNEKDDLMVTSQEYCPV